MISNIQREEDIHRRQPITRPQAYTRTIVCFPGVSDRRRPRCGKKSVTVFVLVSDVMPRKGTL